MATLAQETAARKAADSAEASTRANADQAASRALASAASGFDSRIKALEAWMATQTVTIAPQPKITYTPSAPLTITTDNQTVTGLDFSGTWGTGFGIHAFGSSGTAPIHNLTIRRCRFQGFNVSIQMEYVQNLILEDCVISDVLYAAILGMSIVGGHINRNQIDRVGYQDFPPMDVNAYGIAISRTASGSLVTDPRSANVYVDSNVVNDVPTWEGYDTHSGDTIVWTNNIARRCYHPFVIGPDSDGNQALNALVDRNQVLEAKGRAFGQTVDGNIAAITIRDIHPNSAVTNNKISTTFPTATVGRVYDFLGLSTDMYSAITGNTDVA